MELPPKLLVHTSSYPQPLITTDIFSVPIVLPFPECPINGTISYIAFGVWLLGLRKMHLGFIHVAAGIKLVIFIAK